MPNAARQARRRRARGQPVRLDRRPGRASTRTPAPSASPGWSGRRARTSARSSTPTASGSRSSTTPGRVLDAHRGAARVRRARLRPPARRLDRPAGQHHPPGARRSPPRTASRCVPTKISHAGADGRGRPIRRSASPPTAPGGYILPGFLPAFDGAAALLKMLDLLARADTRLSEVVDGLPKVHLVHDTVVTPWEQKGLVMRSLMEMAGRDVELVDGVKVLLPGRLGARPARPGGAGDARLGRGQHRRRGPPARPGVRAPDPSAAALSALRPAGAARRATLTVVMNVPAELRYSTDHEWTRSRATGSDRHHGLRPGRAR